MKFSKQYQQIIESSTITSLKLIKQLEKLNPSDKIHINVKINNKITDIQATSISELPAIKNNKSNLLDVFIFNSEFSKQIGLSKIKTPNTFEKTNGLTIKDLKDYLKNNIEPNQSINYLTDTKILPLTKIEKVKGLGYNYIILK